MPKKVLCLGDSITFGSVGYTYIKFLKPDIKAVNKGVNGDTTFGANRRLQKYLSDPRYSDIDTYIVFIGINDLLGPYLTTLSPIWKMQMQPNVVLKKCYIEDDRFCEAYERIIRLLEQHGKKAVLIGLPFLQMKGFQSERIKQRNRMIKSLAERYGLPYIDAYSLQQSALKKPPRMYSWGFTGLFRALDAIIMLLLPFSKDMFSKLRRLALTVDGVHFNSLSARLIAKSVAENLAEE